MEPSAACSSSWCPKGLFEHLACWCFTGKQKILWDSVFGAWGCASIIHSVCELQINTFRLLYGKIAGSLLAFLQKLCIETRVPEAVSYSLCHWNSTASSAPTAKTWAAWNQWAIISVGKEESVGLLSSSVATSLWSCHWASLSKTRNRGKREEFSHM